MLGSWHGQRVGFTPADLAEAAGRIREPLFLVREPQQGRVGVAFDGQVAPAGSTPYEAIGYLPPIYPEWLGDRGFLEAHGVRFPYVAGAMANGIATAEMVVAMARAGMLGFFGAAGLSYGRIEEGLDAIEQALGPDGGTWGSNLIHAPNEPGLEAATAALYVQRGVRRVSASAFMSLTPALVHYACHGLAQDAQGRITRTNHVFAKISRAETARAFMTPAPAALLDKLVQEGKLTAEEARLARHVPVAEDITVESDSGGHTDNRPLGALLPEILLLRDRLAAEHGYTRPIRVGAAGGLGTPGAVAAAFGYGAAYVLTGSVNQSAVESGLSAEGRRMLAQTGLADVMMAPAADMFEQGVEVQVLKRGTFFGPRAARLYELYTTYPSLEAIPDDVRTQVEAKVLHAAIDDIWAETEAFWGRRDPDELARAQRDPKHRMALVFRWYLGKASRWAIDGTPDRAMDYQIWCGPAMGAFNSWVKGSFLEPAEHRGVVQIALNLMEGAARVTRAGQLRASGLPVPPSGFDFRPRPLYAG